MHELFEHTADLGLRAQAADLNTLFEPSVLFVKLVVPPGRRFLDDGVHFSMEGAADVARALVSPITSQQPR